MNRSGDLWLCCLHISLDTSTHSSPSDMTLSERQELANKFQTHSICFLSQNETRKKCSPFIKNYIIRSFKPWNINFFHWYHHKSDFKRAEGESGVKERTHLKFLIRQVIYVLFMRASPVAAAIFRRKKLMSPESKQTIPKCPLISNTEIFI